MTQDEYDDESRYEIVQGAELVGEYFAYAVVYVAEEDIIVEDGIGVGAEVTVHRSTSPIFMSTLPRLTIMSASFQPTNRSLVTVRFSSEGERILQR